MIIAALLAGSVMWFGLARWGAVCDDRRRARRFWRKFGPALFDVSLALARCASAALNMEQASRRLGAAMRIKPRRDHGDQLDALAYAFKLDDKEA